MTTSKIICSWIVVGVIELFPIAGLALMVAKYVLFVDAGCHHLNSASDSNSSSTGYHWFYINGNKIETGGYMYISLILFSVFISLLQIPEYFALGWGTYKWLSHKRPSDISAPPTTCSCNCTCSCCCVVSSSVVVFLFCLD